MELSGRFHAGGRLSPEGDGGLVPLRGKRISKAHAKVLKEQEHGDIVWEQI